MWGGLFLMSEVPQSILRNTGRRMPSVSELSRNAHLSNTLVFQIHKTVLVRPTPSYRGTSRIHNFKPSRTTAGP